MAVILREVDGATTCGVSSLSRETGVPRGFRRHLVKAC